jgi:hypothetical protein
VLLVGLWLRLAVGNWTFVMRRWSSKRSPDSTRTSVVPLVGILSLLLAAIVIPRTPALPAPWQYVVAALVLFGDPGGLPYLTAALYHAVTRSNVHT